MTTKELTTKTFTPVQDVPAAAPNPPADLTNPHLSADDILTENYFSMAALEDWLADRDAESRVLTVTGCTVEYLYDPQQDKDGKNGEWKPVLWFAETDTGLVINKTRSGQLRKMTGSPLLSAWAAAGTVAIKPGIANGKAQIVIAPIEIAAGNGEVSDGYSIEDANEDFFS
jgi:hypothetical protein